jgi:hypothetical protein
MSNADKPLEIQIASLLNKSGKRIYAVEIWHNLENANANAELYIERPQMLWQDLTNLSLEDKLRIAHAFIMGYHS